MAYWNPNRETRLTVDASPTALGAILEQQQQDGTYKVLEYASKSLSDVERKYCQTEREGWAIVWGCERFYRYLIGCEFDLLTDHQPLVHIYSNKSRPSARLERWLLRLQPFKFRIQYKPGKNNPSDALTRLVLQDVIRKTHSSTEEHVNLVAAHSVPKAMSLKEIQDATEKDPTLTLFPP